MNKEMLRHYLKPFPTHPYSSSISSSSIQTQERRGEEEDERVMEECSDVWGGLINGYRDETLGGILLSG